MTMLRLPAVMTLLLLAGAASAQLECLDPPNNNAIAGAVVGALEKLRPLITNGLPDLGIPPLDPLGPLPPIVFDINKEAITLKGSINETTLEHLAEFILCQVNVSIGLRQSIFMEIHLDNLHIGGVYDIDGVVVSLIPIFGSGDFRIDTFNGGLSIKSKIVYAIFKDRLSLKDLQVEIFFDKLEVELECILGCGDMANFVNGFVSTIGDAMFKAVWEKISEGLSDKLEVVINTALEDVSISDLLPKSELLELIAATEREAEDNESLSDEHAEMIEDKMNRRPKFHFNTPHQDKAEAMEFHPIIHPKGAQKHPGYYPKSGHQHPIFRLNRGHKLIGNANEYIDMVLANTAVLIKAAGLEPVKLPSTTLPLGSLGSVKLLEGSLAGLSTVRRSGTSTVDTVADWIFLYTNIAVGKIEASYHGVLVNSAGKEDKFVATVSLDVVDVYLTARADVYSLVLDVDQFVIKDLGRANIKLTGLGLPGWVVAPISEAIVNLFMDNIQALLTGTIKTALQSALNETPWPEM